MTGENGNIRAHSQAGDWGTHHSYDIRHNDMKRLKQIIDAMEPEAVSAASGVYYAVAFRIESTMQVLYKQAQRLSENWAGEDANAAMQQMQKAYSAAREIYQTSGQTGKALNDYAEKQINWQSEVDGFLGSVASSDITHIASPGAGMMANKASHNMMQKIQQDTVNSNNSFPTNIIANMPAPSVTDINPNQSQSPGTGGASVPGTSGGGTPGAGHLPGAGDFPSNTSAGRPPGSDQFPGGGGGTDLAGYTPPGGGGAGGLGDGLGAGGFGAGGASPGALGSGAGGSPGAGGVVGGFPGGVGAGVGVAGKSGMGGMGGGMGQGGRGGEEEERERTTWLAEDEDIWNGDDDAAPPVIG